MSDRTDVKRTNPMLEGNYAPVGIECDASDLPVIGKIPAGLNGTLFRNGPNPQFAPIDPLRHHWFVGDGMVHALTLDEGRASYRNRWVRTAKWKAEHAAGASLTTGFGGPTKGGVAIANEGVANTNIVWHAGRLLALEEAHLPIELDPLTLATRGVRNFDGALQGPFTAHPKIDPVTGELLFFGYSAAGPFTPKMSYGTLGSDGRVSRFEHFDAPYCSMVHDFAVTERHVLFPILPLHGSMTRAQAGQMPYAWEPDLGSYVGLLARDRGVASLRWLRADNCYVFHVLNAWEADGRIFADVIQYDAPPLFPPADGGFGGENNGRLVRWTLDPSAATDAIKMTVLDDMTGEFPRLDERRAGLPNRFGTYAGRSDPAAELDTIVWHDFRAGRRAAFALPKGDGLSEPVFVPRREQADEGDGWLVAVAWRAKDARSEIIVLDTDDVTRGPIATVCLPQRVPFGFHGNWVGDIV
jgi:carotenoid cleavage dioxygenase-like enzyme